MADILKPKRGRHTTIAALNPILADGEIVFEKLDTGTTGYGLIKMGDGHTPYNQLPPFVKYTDPDTFVQIDQKGAANGVAPLNANKLIDAKYLPSFVNDVLEFPTFNEFPEQGEEGKLYVDCSKTSNNVYRWSGTQYICIASSVSYTLTKEGSSVVLQGSDGTRSTVSNVGGVEIRDNEPGQAELYAGKMWIVR